MYFALMVFIACLIICGALIYHYRTEEKALISHPIGKPIPEETIDRNNSVGDFSVGRR
jgi:hypothetical protein